MGVLEIIAGLFKPAVDLVDDIITSDEERLILRNKLAAIQKDVAVQMMDLQGQVLSASSKVAIAETKSDSWYTRIYRPAIITGMFFLMCANAFGWLTVPLPDMFIAIFGSAFGVVGISRGVEKVFTIKGNK